MSQLDFSNIPDRTLHKLLQVLNRANTVDEILAIKDQYPKPEQAENDYWLGETVAGRILSQRMGLRSRRFEEITELNGIAGFGQDKFNDLVEMMSVSSAERFRSYMYEEEIISENFKLVPNTTFFESEESFQSILYNEPAITDAVVDALVKVLSETELGWKGAHLAGDLLRQSYVDRIESGGISSYVWASWFYRFDEDNWFSFSRVYEAIQTYLGDGEKFLLLYKGFPQSTIFGGTSPDDLSVVLDVEELSITLWQTSLFD